MRCSHRFAGWRPIAAISAVGFMARMMLAGGIAGTGGDGPGLKAVVIPGGGPPPRSP